MKNRYLIAAVFALFALAFGDTHYFAVQDGNENYRAGKYDEALKNYRRAQIEKDSKVARYNLGNAYFRKKEYDKAAKLYSGVIESEDRNLALKGMYNYGNSRMAAGDEKASRQKLPEAIEDMKAAEKAFKKTLLENPTDMEAKHNLELALDKLAKLQKEQKKQEKKKKQDSKEKKEKSKENEDNKNEPKNSRENKKKEDKKAEKENENKSAKKEEKKNESKIKPEDVKRILDALAQNEKKVQKEVRSKNMKERRRDKDW